MTGIIIEQYVYRYEDIDSKKLQKLINRLLNIGQTDFTDPLNIANYSVIRPVDDKDKFIEIPTDKTVNQHQIEVLRAYEDSKKK